FGINILMLGIPALLSNALYDSAGSTQQIAIDYLLPNVEQFPESLLLYLSSFIEYFIYISILVGIFAALQVFLRRRPSPTNNSVRRILEIGISLYVILLFIVIFGAFIYCFVWLFQVLDIPIPDISIASVLAFLLVPVSWYVLYKTPFGLRIRAVGENPEAADSAGVSVNRMRYVGIILSGVLAAAGGAYMSIGQSSFFTRGMSAGKGFIALAALILAKWRPVQVLIACLFFGFTEALAIQIQGSSWAKLPSGEDIPVQFIEMLPYVLTIIVLAGFIGSSRAPKSLGIPYKKEQ
ncbi:MAG: hypothetical protein HKN25_02870, partial [Pyrinomonadaceae bacterium]|nr:hypothetical protein [Pyrinomonadaceae bacterium]